MLKRKLGKTLQSQMWDSRRRKDWLPPGIRPRYADPEFPAIAASGTDSFSKDAARAVRSYFEVRAITRYA
jgi:hypothetical protein